MAGVMVCGRCESSPRLKVVHVLSHEDQHSAWNGERGFISAELCQKHLPSPGTGGLVFVCGPPPMYDVLCGPRTEKEVNGLLGELGYPPEEVFKF
jgi:cytochrome-b5 reductase